MKEYTFVEIDMRKDFSDDPRAALPVPGTLGLVGKMAILEAEAHAVIEVFDHHSESDPTSQEEFKEFPPHCLMGTWGFQRIEGLSRTTIQLLKNTYNAWDGMKNTTYPDNLVIVEGGLKKADLIVVGGVVTGICVKAFVEGAIDRGMAKKIIVISDCVANLATTEIPSTSTLFKNWSHEGVVITTFDSFVKQYIKKD